MLGLYIHIPYCRSKCAYCDFASAAVKGGVPDEYVDAVLRELWRFSPCGSTPLRPDTVYLGGGTPSLLTPRQVSRILDAAGPVPGAEITLEANPDTVTRDVLAGFRAAGVNRLSVGVQTASDESLRRIGRRHTAAEAARTLKDARAAGFENISGDIMLALPHYTADEMRDTVALLAGECTHISAYLLKIEPDTVFGRRAPDGVPGDDEAADFYLACVDELAARGYRQYEISNFAQPGFAGRHNLLYWDCRDYLGIGPSAHSCMSGKRFFTPRGTDAFLRADAVYTPDGDCTAQDYIMLRLRLAEGLSLAKLQSRFGVSLTPAQTAFCRSLAQNGLARFDGETLSLTPRGMLVQNSVLTELL